MKIELSELINFLDGTTNEAMNSNLDAAQRKVNQLVYAEPVNEHQILHIVFHESKWFTTSSSISKILSWDEDLLFDQLDARGIYITGSTLVPLERYPKLLNELVYAKVPYFNRHGVVLYPLKNVEDILRLFYCIDFVKLQKVRDLFHRYSGNSWLSHIL